MHVCGSLFIFVVNFRNCRLFRRVMRTVLRWKPWFTEKYHKGSDTGHTSKLTIPFYFSIAFTSGKKAEWLIKVFVLFILRSHNLKPPLACAITGVSPLCSFALQFLLWSFHQAISELWYFTLFWNQSFHSGQVAVLGKGRKEASLSCWGLSLQVLIDKGTRFRWLKEFTLYWDSNISVAFCAQMTSFASFRASFSPASGTFVVSIHSNWSKSLNCSHLRHFFSQTNLPLSQQRCWKLCELQAVSHVYWWTAIWERMKYFFFFFPNVWFTSMESEHHPSRAFPSLQSSVSEWEASGGGN